MMTTTITNDVKVFEQMNVPTYGATELKCFRIPTNLVFGKTYYQERNGKLVAFKIYAYAMARNEKNPHIVYVRKHKDTPFEDIAYYVQYANTELRWECGTIDNVCFESKEDYFNHINNLGNYSVDWGWSNMYKHITKVNGLVMGTYFNNESCFEIKGRYMWDTFLNKPKTANCYIEYVLVSNDGVIFCVSYNKDYSGKHCDGFGTYEECVNNHINGMVVEDFEECSFNLNIEVKVVQPITSVIRVVEVK